MKAWFQKNWGTVAIVVVVLLSLAVLASLVFNQLQHRKYVRAVQEMQDLHAESIKSMQAYYEAVEMSNSSVKSEVAEILVKSHTVIMKNLAEIDESLSQKLAEIDAKHDEYLQLQLKDLKNETESLADDPDSLYREFVRAFGLDTGESSP